ncbi:hypothetical protein [Motiliproteus sp. MSK22-1]|uniref:hypothetical protein n=1 Tax=Motiliproteus sp. MSK22-1 TaxID=1897630 RepID=UPI000977314A|nr:hypothetical protein [Motiliproteus sp. MSK22-1]OMH36268.1 hypothetical protein BGP75_09985 [Motiliproteus sp. MSK22-1]
MALSLYNYNIVRVTDGKKIVNCTIIKMCFDYAVIKYEGTQYKVPYSMIDQVVGHELLMTAQ